MSSSSNIGGCSNTLSSWMRLYIKPAILATFIYHFWQNEWASPAASSSSSSSSSSSKSRGIVSENLLMSHNVKPCSFIRWFISYLYYYTAYLGLLTKIQLSWINHLKIIGKIILTWILDSFWTCELNSTGFGDDLMDGFFWYGDGRTGFIKLFPCG